MTKLLWRPNQGPQTFFLSTTAREVMYGGAAGGGKSDALIIAPLRWVDNPNHRAIVLRRTRRELQEILDRSKVIYPRVVKDATWNEARSRWSFPSGCYISFGFAEHADDIFNYKSNEYNFVGFDELTTFEERMYLFMLSRNRTTDSNLPVMMRSATNPGDIGHDWVFQRFVAKREPFKVYSYPKILPDGTVKTQTRQFILATVYDNPELADKDTYIAGLLEMGEDLAAAMLFGRWDVFEGQFFRKLPVEVKPELLDPEDYYVIRCMDYGLNDPSAIYWLVVYPRRPIIDIVSEIYQAEVTLPDLSRMITRRQAELKLNAPRISVGDPSSMFKRETTSQGQTIAQIMSRHGAIFSPANNDRAAGWAMLRYLFETGKMRVWQGCAPMLLRTLPTLKYDPANRDDIYHKGRVKDHGADAIRYGALCWYEQPAPLAPEKAMNPQIQDTIYPRVVRAAERAAQGRFDSFEHLGL